MEGGNKPSEYILVFFWLNLSLTSSLQADHLKVQELMDSHLNSRDKELCKLHAQLQEDGAKLAALSLQLQEVISGVDE